MPERIFYTNVRPFKQSSTLPVWSKLGETSLSAKVKNMRPTLMHMQAMKSSLVYCFPGEKRHINKGTATLNSTMDV